MCGTRDQPMTYNNATMIIPCHHCWLIGSFADEDRVYMDLNPGRDFHPSKIMCQKFANAIQGAPHDGRCSNQHYC